jgi:hypothetical protein
MVIIKAEDLPEHEQVYLKKSFDGWRVVHPIRNEDGSLNWVNLIFGGRSNLIKLMFLVLILSLFFFGVNELLEAYKEVARNPCNFCKDCLNNEASKINKLLNISLDRLQLK